MAETLVRCDPFTGAEMPRVDVPEADILRILRGKLHTFSVRSEDRGAIVVEALLPHFGPEDITLTISTGHLLIQAERYEKADEKYAVRGSSGFYRSVTLPPESRVESAAAEFSDGLLRVTVPLVEETECSVSTPLAWADLSTAPSRGTLDPTWAVLLGAG
ncbi:Hsp20/alpha crystallin family protein [Nesterenkonia sp. NBAIMH1]|uniref:Hsp20/alpha crystallin family protein n=1 Tax=Nesterenkonia sp. NBAIMH1 TaxID=2600320 RepID=UPI0011B3CFB2|nr:Hsp20/alpha crystallin family protein [Nesterenkonia sp. NBAIMH1]